MEAKGFILGYTISYSPVSSRKRQSGTVTAGADVDNAIISGLKRDSAYSFAVSASTSAGRGDTSDPYQVQPSVNEGQYNILALYICVYMYMCVLHVCAPLWLSVDTCTVHVSLCCVCDGFIFLSLFFRFYQCASVCYTCCVGCVAGVDCDCYHSCDFVRFKVSQKTKQIYSNTNTCMYSVHTML